MGTKHVLVIGDLHAGSLYAPWPPGLYRTDSDPPTQINVNPTQEQLNRCWEHLVSHVPRLDHLVLNGDIIDGENPAEGGRFIVSPSEFDQAEGALALLAPLAKKAKNVHIVRGTPYHEGRAYEALCWISKQLGASLPTTELILDVNGRTIHFSHHQTRGWIYPSGGAERTVLFSLALQALGRIPRVDVIVRSHLHILRVIHAYGRWAVMTPAWKIVTPYAERRMEAFRAGLYSDIGAVLISVSGGGAINIDAESFVYRAETDTAG